MQSTTQSAMQPYLEAMVTDCSDGCKTYKTQQYTGDVKEGRFQIGNFLVSIEKPEEDGYMYVIYFLKVSNEADSRFIGSLGPTWGLTKNELKNMLDKIVNYNDDLEYPYHGQMPFEGEYASYLMNSEKFQCCDRYDIEEGILYPKPGNIYYGDIKLSIQFDNLIIGNFFEIMMYNQSNKEEVSAFLDKISKGDYYNGDPVRYLNKNQTRDFLGEIKVYVDSNVTDVTDSCENEESDENEESGVNEEPSSTRNSLWGV